MKREWFRRFFDADYLSILEEQFPQATTRQQVEFLVRKMALPRGARILDVPCGYGRHAAALARRGYRVTGVDLSPAMVAAGRRRFGKVAGLTLRRGDIRALPYRGEFDAVLCLFTSVGYFSPAQNERTVRLLVGAARQGGWIVIDHRNLDWSRRYFTPRVWWQVGKKTYVAEEASFDRRRGIIESAWHVLRPGERRVVRKHFRIQQYDLRQWRAMLRRAGARLVSWTTGFDSGKHVTYQRPRLVLFARHAGSRRSTIVS